MPRISVPSTMISATSCSSCGRSPDADATRDDSAEVRSDRLLTMRSRRGGSGGSRAPPQEAQWRRPTLLDSLHRRLGSTSYQLDDGGQVLRDAFASHRVHHEERGALVDRLEPHSAC